MRQRHFSQGMIVGTLLAFLALTFVPVVLMLFMSFKTNADIYTNFWAPPSSMKWEHYAKAFGFVRLYLWNSILVCVLATGGVIFLSSLSGYVFARHEFPFKNSLFLMILFLMMIPGILTLIPMFLLVKDLGLLNTRLGLILPYISGGQVVGILLCRTFIAEIPRDLFDAARIDGASEFTVYSRIVVPLSFPILATVGIMTVFGVYNDFIWPLLVITDHTKQVFTVALLSMGGGYRMEMGDMLAGYTIGCVPLLLMISFGMKYFVRGVTSGALKA